MNTAVISNVQIEGIDTHDYPDFCDAYIVYAERNGTPLTEDELNELNEDADFIHEQVFDKLF